MYRIYCLRNKKSQFQSIYSEVKQKASSRDNLQIYQRIFDVKLVSVVQEEDEKKKKKKAKKKKSGVCLPLTYAPLMYP